MIKTFRFDNSSEFSSNSYIVSDNSGNCVVIDPGSTSDRIIEYIKSNCKSCKAIFLTHGHWDHIRGVKKILNFDQSIKVYVNQEDQVMLENSRLNCSIVIDRNSGTINSETIFYENDDILNISESLIFKIIETPFHTKGSVCILFKKENALFTGDSLFKGSIGRTDLPHNAARKQKESLQIIKSLDANLKIFPGHGDETTLANELKNNIYLK